MNYLNYFKTSGQSQWPIPDTIQVNNLLLPETESVAIDYGPITINGIKHVGELIDKLLQFW